MDVPPNPEAADDFELLRRWRRGDRRAGNALAARHYEALRFFLLGKINADTASDLAQDAFFTVCKNLDAFEGRSSFRTYLFGIAWRKLVEHLRKLHGRAFDPLAQSFVDRKLEARISSMVALREYERRVVAILREFPLHDQLILSRKAYQGMTSREIGEIFDMSTPQVDGRLRRARERLKERLENSSLTKMVRPRGLSGPDDGDLLEWIDEILLRLHGHDG